MPNSALREGRGNDGRWKARKTKQRFSSLPTALGNRVAISTFPPPRRRILSLNPKKPQKPNYRKEPSLDPVFPAPFRLIFRLENALRWRERVRDMKVGKVRVLFF